MSDVEKYGLPGIFILLLIGAFKIGWDFLKDLMKQHAEEREEWRKSQERLQDDTNKNIKENTNILSGLKTLLENRK